MLLLDNNRAVQAEQVLLGTVIKNNDKLLDAIEILKPEDFYSTKHKVIYSTMIDMFKNDMPIETIAINDYLKGDIGKVGGLSYLMSLEDGAMRTENVKHYASIIKEYSRKRQLLEVAKEINRDIDGDISLLTQNLEDLLLNINDGNENSYLKDNELMCKVLQDIEDTYKNGGPVGGIKTGIADIDKYMNIKKGDLITIAGRPSMGKTCLALNIADNMIFNDTKVMLFELEMSAEKLAVRRISARAKIPAEYINNGALAPMDFEKINNAAIEYSNKNNMFTDCTAGLSILEIKSKAKKIKIRYGLDVIIIDHIGLLTPPKGLNNKVLEIAEITRQAKIMAKELDVAVILLSQLNRGVEARNDKKPILSDLRDSGAIEQDSDIVIGVYRDEYYKPNTEDKNILQAIILKNRDGKVGTIKLYYDSDKQFIGSLDKHYKRN